MKLAAFKKFFSYALLILKTIFRAFSRAVQFLCHAYHWLWALWGALRYRFPSRKLIVIGVTGTNGKSTTVAFLHEIFLKAGMPVGSLSSLRFKINGEEKKNELKMTMPGRGRIQRFLRECLSHECRVAVIEVTSEGIRQFRHGFINFDGGVFTNLTPEHIESHGGFEEYRAMKKKFFRAVARARRKTLQGKKIEKIISVNLDDPEYKHFLAEGIDRSVGYTLEGRKDSSLTNIISAEDVSLGQQGVSFLYNGTRFSSALSGVFNVSNMLAALSMAAEFGVSIHAAQQAFASLPGVPGRFEYIREGQDYDIIVDYAHTPDAQKKVYEAIKQKNPSTSLICVFGAAGGGRDTWKRPEFAKIAGEFCREAILTTEDPYDEDPMNILRDIEKGVLPRTFTKILDRREAIRTALQKAGKGDTVIITGKGAEPWIMGPHGEKIPWDDREVARGEVRNELLHSEREIQRGL